MNTHNNNDDNNNDSVKQNDIKGHKRAEARNITSRKESREKWKRQRKLCTRKCGTTITSTKTLTTLCGTDVLCNFNYELYTMKLLYMCECLSEYILCIHVHTCIYMGSAGALQLRFCYSFPSMHKHLPFVPASSAITDHYRLSLSATTFICRRSSRPCPRRHVLSHSSW